MNVFKKKIICAYCGKFHKRASGSYYFSCSTYDNYGKDKCKRNPIDQDEIIELLTRRFNKELTDEEIKHEVTLIKISEEELYIELANDKPIIVTGKFAQF